MMAQARLGCSGSVVISLFSTPGRIGSRGWQPHVGSGGETVTMSMCRWSGLPPFDPELMGSKSGVGSPLASCVMLYCPRPHKLPPSVRPDREMVRAASSNVHESGAPPITYGSRKYPLGSASSAASSSHTEPWEVTLGHSSNAKPLVSSKSSPIRSPVISRSEERRVGKEHSAGRQGERY